MFFVSLLFSIFFIFSFIVIGNLIWILMKKSLGKIVCPWPECIFRSLLQFLVIFSFIVICNSISFIHLFTFVVTLLFVTHVTIDIQLWLKHHVIHEMYTSVRISLTHCGHKSHMCKLISPSLAQVMAFGLCGTIADHPADNYDGLDSISMNDVIDKHCNHPSITGIKTYIGRKSLSLNLRKSLQIMSLNSSSPSTLENHLVMMVFRINSWN